MAYHRHAYTCVFAVTLLYGLRLGPTSVQADACPCRQYTLCAAESFRLRFSFCELPPEENTRPNSSRHHPHSMRSVPSQLPSPRQVLAQASSHSVPPEHGPVVC